MKSFVVLCLWFILKMREDEWRNVHYNFHYRDWHNLFIKWQKKKNNTRSTLYCIHNDADDAYRYYSIMLCESYLQWKQTTTQQTTNCEQISFFIFPFCACFTRIKFRIVVHDFEYARASQSNKSRQRQQLCLRWEKL